MAEKASVFEEIEGVHHRAFSVTHIGRRGVFGIFRGGIFGIRCLI